jgi:hypothetical protein
MTQKNREPIPAETGEQVPARPHDSGSQANETVDGLDATAEALRHAAEDTPTGTGTADVSEKVMVTKKHGIIIETTPEARQAERGLSMLAALLAIGIGLSVIFLCVVWFVVFRI